MEVGIDALDVGKCYKLSTGTELGKLTAQPEIMGSGDGREKTAIFDNNGKKTFVPRWNNYEKGEKNMFIKVDCKQTAGRRKKFRTIKKSRKNRRRYSRRN